ncbi:cytochrome c oxidase assembly protein [Thermomonospora curvata]|uniref:Copper resistance D domain protein n=1 Tax=Thermomonospora curvata (strain ATCC 19995 / DSM 43183 / JCM 3096 / KCTC 9072 / NBRC 15933 / NCIMB 10081 / Henssen B9) TaxID=471852 RepID=D1A928_THECD|nr:cytochrome c oxidase assembly protein [Thermomonospora curvata]ACY98666.1 copper resistance D domain protein [Thermomonospora curvata DSM 43183]
MSKGVAQVARAAAIAVAAAGAALAAAMVAGGAAAEEIVPGIGDAGALTRWGLPVARVAMHAAAALTVGALLAATMLLPLEVAGGKGRLSADALTYLRAASWLGAGWAAAAAAALVFTVSDVLGEPVGQVLTGNRLSGYVGDLPQATALMLVILLAVLVALLARTTATVNGAAGLLVTALVALLPPPLTGHAASAGNHSLAVTSMALHVLAVALWVGGLAMLGRHVLTGGGRPEIMAGRYSRMALWCYIVVGVSGIAGTMARLPGPAELVTTSYGRLVLAKIVLFGALGWFGWWHRRRTLPELAERRPGAFARLAAVEVAVMAAVLGVATALARTAPPAPLLDENAVQVLLGYPMPPQITFGRVLTLWKLDFFFALLVVVLGGLYLAGVARLRARGDRWPMLRTVSWFFGLLTIVLVTQSGLARYAPLLFSMHMVQHMTLSMLTPIFMVLGDPITLALRAIKPAPVRGDRGPREWLLVLLHSRYVRVISHPVVAAAIFVVTTFALYFTPLFANAMRNHLGHIAMEIHFLAAGALFFWVLIGVGPTPRKVPYVAKLVTLFATMPFHAFFGIALMSLGEPLAEGWYRSVHPDWAASILSDQHAGGAIAWGFGEIPTFIVLLALVVQWFLDDQRTARREDRKAERAAARHEEDELAAYNARLAALARRDERMKKTAGGGTGEGGS